MATITAVRSGNWSDTSHVTGPWPGGSTPTTKPGAGDTVETDEYIVEIDENVTVALLKGTSNGMFGITNSGNKVVHADLLNSGSAEGFFAISNSTVSVIGSVTGGSVPGATAIFNMGAITITGNVAGGAGDSASGIRNMGTITITGNVTGGNGASANGIYNTGGTINFVTGNVTGGNGASANGIYNEEGTINFVTGNVTCGAGQNAYGIYSDSLLGGVDGRIVWDTSNGQFPIYGPFRMIASPNSSITVVASDNTPLTLSNDYPAEADVRADVAYNRGTMTGELATGTVGPVNIVIGGGGIRIS